MPPAIARAGRQPISRARNGRLAAANMPPIGTAAWRIPIAMPRLPLRNHAATATMPARIDKAWRAPLAMSRTSVSGAVGEAAASSASTPLARPPARIMRRSP